MSHSARPRIVITGCGLVSPLGNGIEEVWDRLLSGHSGVTTMVCQDKEAGELIYPVGRVLNLDVDRFFSAKERSRTNRFVQLAVAATEQALSQAGWLETSEEEKLRTAVILGTGLGGVCSLLEADESLAQRGRRTVSAFSMPLALANSAAGAVSIRYGFRGAI